MDLVDLAPLLVPVATVYASALILRVGVEVCYRKGLALKRCVLGLSAWLIVLWWAALAYEMSLAVAYAENGAAFWLKGVVIFVVAAGCASVSAAVALAVVRPDKVERSLFGVEEYSFDYWWSFHTAFIAALAGVLPLAAVVRWLMFD